MDLLSHCLANPYIVKVKHCTLSPLGHRHCSAYGIWKWSWWRQMAVLSVGKGVVELCWVTLAPTLKSTSFPPGVSLPFKGKYLFPSNLSHSGDIFKNKFNPRYGGETGLESFQVVWSLGSSVLPSWTACLIPWASSVKWNHSSHPLGYDEDQENLKMLCKFKSSYWNISSLL